MPPSQSSRPVAIIGHVPPPPLWRRPARAFHATVHKVGFALWRGSAWRMDDDQPQLVDPSRDSYIESLEENVEMYLMRAERAERERDEISDSLAKADEKWWHAYNRLRDYESANGEPV